MVGTVEVGSIIDRYAVEAFIGEGGMATVWRVRHTTLGTWHALKLLKVSSPSIRERLLQEGRMQAALRHPNIVAVTDAVVVDGTPGLLMELVDGCPLDRWLKSNRATLPQAEAIFGGIVAGVARAHRDSLVHRDLKPGNVLLARSEEGVTPKVTDFGLAKVLSDTTPAPGFGATRSGVAMGTPQYMAPEQIRDARSVDHRTDIWALGCILYELLAGTQAFNAPDLYALYARIVVGDHPPVSTFRPDLPLRWHKTLAGCLTPDREQRFPDCAAVSQCFLGQSRTPSGAFVLPGVDSSFGEAPPTGPITVRDNLAAPTFASAGGTMAQLEGGAAPPASFPPSTLAGPVPGPRRWPGRWWLGGAAGVGVLAAAAAIVTAGRSDAPPAPPPPAEETSEEAKLAIQEPAPVEPAPAVSEPARPPSRAKVPPSRPVEPPPEAVPVAPATTPTASVAFEGDATSVWLERDGKRFPSSELAAGTYTVYATFGDSGRVPAAELTLAEGQQVTLRCSAIFKRCVP
jgi:serine/threonine-protein kinase